MTRRRWIADKVSCNHAILTGDHADHLVRVLRARVGQEFDISTGEVVRVGRIVTIQPGRVDFDLGENVATSRVANVSLLVAIFKFDRMEWAIEKCTELGISRILPVIARRTDAHLAAAAAKRVERWRRIALQAAEQSRRAAPPEIVDPVRLQEPTDMSSAAVRIGLDESEKTTLLRDVFSMFPSGEIVLAVGPEGGWTDEELQFFDKTGWVSISLGSTILRAETAAIAAIAITISEAAP